MTELRKKILPIFTYYTPKSDLHYINDINPISDINSTMDNTFDIDFDFIKKAYPDLENKSNDELIKYIKEIEFSNLFFHSKQLVNIFDNKIQFKVYKDNIYVKYKDTDYLLTDFIKLISHFTYDDYKKSLLTKIKNNNFTSDELLIALFIGNKDIGISILKKLNQYKDKQSHQLAICIKKSIFTSSEFVEIDNFLKSNNMNYVLYVSNELGSDVTPTLLMYDDIRNNYHFNYIMKIHTKKDEFMRNALVNALLSYRLDKEKMKLENEKRSACFGSLKYYINIKKDTLNKHLYKKFENLICYDHFIAGTIFFTNYIAMDNMLVFLKANYLSIFTQNTYETNQINKNHSYTHFIERLFGIINNKLPLFASPIE